MNLNILPKEIINYIKSFLLVKCSECNYSKNNCEEKKHIFYQYIIKFFGYDINILVSYFLGMEPAHLTLYPGWRWIVWRGVFRMDLEEVVHPESGSLGAGPS